MPTIAVPEATYQRLSRRATALCTTIEALAEPALEQIAREPEAERPPLDSANEMTIEEWKKGMVAWQAVVESRADRYPPKEVPYDQWKILFDAHMRDVESRADRYPPGHITDCSRESIYEGCGE